MFSSDFKGKPSSVTPPTVKYIPKMDPYENYYNLNKSRGLAVIFYHTNIPGYTKLNTEYDAERFEKCFEKFNFDVEKYANLTYLEILTVINQIATKDSSTLSCLIIAVSTHGNENTIEALDEPYETNILWKTFAGKLVGIPKLFFIDACRGEKEDLGVEVADGPTRKKKYIYKLPTMADYLFMFSTYEGHVAYDLDDGSYFMRSVCNEIEEKYKDWDILQILTFVNRKVAVDFNGEFEDLKVKAMPQIVTMLTKLLKLNMTEPICTDL